MGNQQCHTYVTRSSKRVKQTITNKKSK